MVGRSKVWKLSHFANAEKTEVQCDICPTKIKFVGNTTNIARHLELKHPVEYAALLSSMQQGNTQTNANEESSASDKQTFNSKNMKQVVYFSRKPKVDENLAIRRILQIHNRELQKLKAQESHKQSEPEFIGPHPTSEAKNLLWSWHCPVTDGKFY